MPLKCDGQAVYKITEIKNKSYKSLQILELKTLKLKTMYHPV